MSKGARVWVAVDADGYVFLRTISDMRRLVEEVLDQTAIFVGWRDEGITIRRATLVLDPPKPSKPKRFQSSAFKAAQSNSPSASAKVQHDPR